MTIDRVQRAFEAAMLRLCQAQTFAVQEDELSNMLHHLYRLGEVRKHTLGSTSFFKAMGSTVELRAARAILWARGFDTHQAHLAAV